MSTQDRDMTLLKRYRSGDCEAGHELILNYQKLIYKLAHAAHREHHRVDFQDICQEAFFGGLKAIDKYDESRGLQFKGYINWWFRSAITKYCGDNNVSSMRIPICAQKKIQPISAAGAQSPNE
jgi:RNA polymerase sigma factor (sigma-70 family)